MFTGWVHRFGLALALGGLLAVAAGAWWPASAEELSTATAPAVTAEEAPPPPWRSALMLAGGICLVAGVGLVVLAIFPDRARRQGR